MSTKYKSSKAGYDELNPKGYNDWRLNYQDKCASDVTFKNIGYDLQILDDVAVLAVLSFINEEMNIQVDYLVDRLSRFKKPSRTTRVLEINKLYEKAQKQGYTIKACVLPNEQCKAFYLFCSLNLCYKDLKKLEQIVEGIVKETNRWSQQVYLVDFYSMVALRWLGLYWRLIQEKDSQLPAAITANTDNLSLIAAKWKIRQPSCGSFGLLDPFYWRESQCFGNTDDPKCEI